MYVWSTNNVVRLDTMMEFSSEDIERAIDTAMRKAEVKELKKEQRGTIHEFVSGRDVFVSLPTGYGKSFCYALLPAVFDGLRGSIGTSIVICVSPLTALMMEQRNKFIMRGIATEFVGELQQDVDAMESVKSGKIQLLFISPESLLNNPQWREMLISPVYQTNLVALVIDEAHCIIQWGDSFRTDYRRLGEIRSLIPITVHVMAVTATATKSSRSKIMHILQMERPQIVYISPCKKNIFYMVKKKPPMEEFVRELADSLCNLKTSMPRIIIFCRRYMECAQMYQLFHHYLGKDFTEPSGISHGIAKCRLVDMYCKCTEPDVKEAIVRAFSLPNGNLRIVIATIAFGMGLDCPDVRQVIHWGPSHDIESYVQETGRGGRDGFLSCALLFYCDSDNRTSSPLMMEYCTLKTCRRTQLFQDFEESDVRVAACRPCMCCDECMVTCKCDSCNTGCSIKNVFHCVA